MSEENKNTELNLDVVKQYFEANKESEEVQQFTKSLVNPNLVESYLSSEDGKKIIQPKLDKHFTKGLETWKQNNLQSIIDAEINKKFPAETEEQKQLRALQQKLEAIENEKAFATVKTEAMKELNTKGLPVGLVDYLVTNNLEETRDRINSFSTEFSNAVKEEVDKRLKNSGATPKNDGADSTKGKMTKADLLNMDYSERVKFYNENPEEFTRIMKG